MADQHVRPPVRRLTDADARHLLADGLIRACHVYGPSRVALEIGCDEKTVRRARDEDSTLGLACSWNLLDVDPHGLDALAAAKGVRLVPIESRCDVDLLAAGSGVVHKMAVMRSASSPGGCSETEAEIVDLEADLDVLEAATAALRAKIARIKLKRAAPEPFSTKKAG